MHSKIFQITTTKVDKECYLNGKYPFYYIFFRGIRKYMG